MRQLLRTAANDPLPEQSKVIGARYSPMWYLGNFSRPSISPRCPCSASSAPAAEPAGPAPIITASYWFSWLMFLVPSLSLLLLPDRWQNLNNFGERPILRIEQR